MSRKMLVLVLAPIVAWLVSCGAAIQTVVTSDAFDAPETCGTFVVGARLYEARPLNTTLGCRAIQRTLIAYLTDESYCDPPGCPRHVGRFDCMTQLRRFGQEVGCWAGSSTAFTAAPQRS